MRQEYFVRFFSSHCCTWFQQKHSCRCDHIDTPSDQRRRSTFLGYCTWLFCTSWFPIWDAGVTPSGRAGRNATMLGVVWREKWKDDHSYPPLSLLANQFIFVHRIGCVLEAVDRGKCRSAKLWNTSPHVCHDKCQVFNPKDVVNHIQSHSCTNWRWIGWMSGFPITIIHFFSYPIVLTLFSLCVVGWGANWDANESNVRHGARWHGPDT